MVNETMLNVLKSKDFALKTEQMRKKCKVLLSGSIDLKQLRNERPDLWKKLLELGKEHDDLEDAQSKLCRK